MLKSISKVLAAAIALGSGLGASANITADETAYFDVGQYSASLSQNAHLWRLQPLAGDDVDVVDRACVNRIHVPHGVWLVSRDADGRPQLIAPSTTPLPKGYPEQIALRACGESSGDDKALAVPPVVLAWIEANVNSVLIDE